jgi:hypothetical protein
VFWATVLASNSNPREKASCSCCGGEVPRFSETRVCGNVEQNGRVSSAMSLRLSRTSIESQEPSRSSTDRAQPTLVFSHNP